MVAIGTVISETSLFLHRATSTSNFGPHEEAEKQRVRWKLHALSQRDRLGSRRGLGCLRRPFRLPCFGHVLIVPVSSQAV